MVGTNVALCVDFWTHGFLDIIGFCVAETEVLVSIPLNNEE